MTTRLSKPFRKDYARLPTKIRKKVDRQINTLTIDFRHPSLNVKKMRGKGDYWEARVDYKHRLTFQIHNDIIVLRAVGSHDVLKKS